MSAKNKKDVKITNHDSFSSYESDDGVIYVHCRQCLAELPVGQSPSDYASLEVVILQGHYVGVGCKRHKAPVSLFKLAAEEISAEDCECEACAVKQREFFKQGH